MKEIISLEFIQNNKARALRWHKGNLQNWSPAEWGNAIAGEVGEFCNVAKKIKRHDEGMQQNAVGPTDAETRDKLVQMSAMELADVVTYCVVTASAMGININMALRQKFNEISEREGFPERV